MHTKYQKSCEILNKKVAKNFKRLHKNEKKYLKKTKIMKK